MKTHHVKVFIRGVLAMVALIATITTVGGAVGKAEPVGDHYIDNLGDGVTALGFSDTNSNEDCTTETFLAGGYDLWHFVVNNTTDSLSYLVWNEANSVWSSPSSVNVVDVTEQYGNYLPGDSVKHLWIATTPPGATLNTAYLDYDGDAGREVLSHTCSPDAITPSLEVDPTVEYDMAYEWQVDKQVDWSVDPTGGYSLDYVVEATRSDLPSVVPDSLHVTGNIIVTPSTIELTALDVAFTQGAYTAPCDVELAELAYDCSLDESQVQIDSTTGRPTGTATLSGTGTYSGGTLQDSTGLDFDGSTLTNVFAETAMLYDDYATPADTTDDLSTDTSELSYTYHWIPTGTSCIERTNTAIVIPDNPVVDAENPTDSVTVKWCPPLAGLTIGYWGNKTGSPFVVTKIVALKAQYPNALKSVPTFATASAVRTFFTNATCSGTCESMFAAQLLATSLNALNPTFAGQEIVFMDSCITVSQLLTQANAGAVGATKDWFVKYEKIFDDINNSREMTCLTVTD
jgi:hypothetical protein